LALVILRIWAAAVLAALAFASAAHAASPPSVTARAFIVENAATGEYSHSMRLDRRRSQASPS